MLLKRDIQIYQISGTSLLTFFKFRNFPPINNPFQAYNYNYSKGEKKEKEIIRSSEQ